MSDGSFFCGEFYRAGQCLSKDKMKPEYREREYYLYMTLIMGGQNNIVAITTSALCSHLFFIWMFKGPK